MICFCKKEMQEIIVQKQPFFYCSQCQYLKKEKEISLTLQFARYNAHTCDLNYKAYMKTIYSKILPFVKGTKILDYGCGKIHYLADLFKEAGYNSFYYDLFYFQDYPTTKFDTIILNEVFEHVFDSKELLISLKKLINPNGVILILTNPLPSDFGNWWYLRDSTHVTFVSEKAMVNLSSLVGLKCLYFPKNLFVLTCI